MRKITVMLSVRSKTQWIFIGAYGINCPNNKKYSERAKEYRNHHAKALGIKTSELKYAWRVGW